MLFTFCCMPQIIIYRSRRYVYKTVFSPRLRLYVDLLLHKSVLIRPKKNTNKKQKPPIQFHFKWVKTYATWRVSRKKNQLVASSSPKSFVSVATLSLNVQLFARQITRDHVNRHRLSLCLIRSRQINLYVNRIRITCASSSFAYDCLILCRQMNAG